MPGLDQRLLGDERGQALIPVLDWAARLLGQTLGKHPDRRRLRPLTAGQTGREADDQADRVVTVDDRVQSRQAAALQVYGFNGAGDQPQLVADRDADAAAADVEPDESRGWRYPALRW